MDASYELNDYSDGPSTAFLLTLFTFVHFSLLSDDGLTDAQVRGLTGSGILELICFCLKIPANRSCAYFLLGFDPVKQSSTHLENPGISTKLTYYSLYDEKNRFLYISIFFKILLSV